MYMYVCAHVKKKYVGRLDIFCFDNYCENKQKGLSPGTPKFNLIY